ncbi:MAG: c-type cytochrome [Chloroflexi bacterium]|nr:c-type cytochrome [Chloroflexota bacterium]
MKGTAQPMVPPSLRAIFRNKRAWPLALAMALAFALAGCSRGSYPLDFFSEMHYNQSYKAQEPQAAGELPRGSSAPSDSVPVTGRGLPYDLAQARALANPAPSDAATIAQGAYLFKVNCAMCHGADAKGGSSGPLGPRLTAAGYLNPPADLTGTGPAAKKVDGEVFFVISKGYAGAYGLPAGSFVMPPFEKLMSEESRWEVVRYLRSLP